MEHRLGAALRSGSSVLTAVVSDNTALHTAIQVAEGHQLTAGARKLAGCRPANFSSITILYRTWWYTLQYCTEHGGIHYNTVQNMMVYITILYRTWWYTLQYCTEHRS